MFNRAVVAVFFVMICAGTAFGMHPLVTDDTGTQGKGKFQLELNYEFGHEDDDGLREHTHELETVLSYGIIDSVDFVVGIPFQYISTKEDGEKVTEEGISDMSIEVKWRFFERENLSFAIKPGLSIPSGNEHEGLGTGRVGGSIFFIASMGLEPWTFHFNTGYGRNENKAGEEEDIWHVSLASELEVCKWLTLVANVGVEENTDKESNTPPVFALGGFVVPVTENLDIDFGVKVGLTEPEVDYSLLAGLAFRF